MDYSLPQQKQNTIERIFILGAGFSKAIRGDEVPLRKGQKGLFERLKIPEEIKDRYKTDDIEIFITELDREIFRLKDNEPNKKEYKNLRDNIKQQIVKIFYNLLDLNKYTNVAKKFGEKLRCNDIIITFNYDVFLEQYLCEKLKIWSPFGGYGPIVRCEVPSNHGNENSNKKNIIILKPHGSINFIEVPILDINKEEYTWIGLEIRQEIFPSLNCNISYGLGQGSCALILPTYFQQSFPVQFLKLYHLAEELIKKTKKIIIGYSLPPEDAKANELFSFIEPNKYIENREILIINGNDSEITKKRIEKMIWLRPNFLRGVKRCRFTMLSRSYNCNHWLQKLIKSGGQNNIEFLNSTFDNQKLAPVVQEIGSDN
jgi:hypothetical protein